MNGIPVVDIAGFIDGSDKESAAAAIRVACEEIGFFMVKGHGISAEIIHAANDAARQFFDQSLSEKSAVKSPGGMGYIGPDGENLAASLDDEQVVDVKESLNLTLPIDAAIWPAKPEQLATDCKRYLDSLLDLSKHMMRLFALALELPETWFDDKTDDPRTILRLLNYPAVRSDAQSRAGAHTDYGTLTILWSPDSRGLQARDRSGTWVDVVAPADHFIINIGDLMMNWTNDKWISTLHRVVPHPATQGRRRQSMAFFHNPNPDAVIECIASCQSADNPARYKPMLAKEHLQMKIEKSLGEKVEI